MAFSDDRVSQDNYRQWQAPPAASKEDTKLGWLQECQETGLSWLKSQRGSSDWRKALDVISGKLMSADIPQYRSQLNTNHLKRNIREIVGVLSKLRPLWGYSSDNPAYAKSANQFNLLIRALFLENDWDRAIKEALQYCAATCTGWIRPTYTRDLVSGEGSIQLFSYGAPCVLPTQLPPSGNFQKAYAMTLLDEQPIYMAHALFPLFQHRLQPTSSVYWYSNEIRKSAQGNLWKRIFGQSTTSGPTNLPDLMIPIRYTTVCDLSRNTTGTNPKTATMIPMGEPGSTWYYEVPYIGQPWPSGHGRNKDGQPIADENDARLYPYRRLLISSETCVMYDGTAFWWHGRSDLIPFSTDHWPWEPLGFSMVRDGYDLQQTITEQERGMADKKRVQLDSPLAYDINSVSSREAKAFDPMQPRARIGFDGSQVDKPFSSPIDPNVIKLDPTDFTWLEYLANSMDSQHAIKDAMALAQARMAGSDLEKLLEATGPIIEDMSRSMEPPIREIAEQVKFLTMQFLPTARVMQYVGSDNITLENFDYDPASLVPSHMPGENPGTADVPVKSAYNQIQRSRMFASNLRYVTTPRSVHEITQLKMQLGLIQLKKVGVKIDSQTIADSWGIPNYGIIPGSTVMEKAAHEQEQDLVFAARMREIGVDLAQGSQPGAPAPGKSGPEGRPPSGNAAPALKQRTDGSSTITQSEGGGQQVQ
jgi:hypothetical protein